MHFVTSSEMINNDISRSAVSNVDKATLNIYAMNETLNSSTDSSGYITSNNISSSGSNSSFNQSVTNADESDAKIAFGDEKIITQSPLIGIAPNLTDVSNNMRRRTISSNSNRYDEHIFKCLNKK